MDQNEADFLKRLQATFRVEAEEHVQALLAGLIELEKGPPAAELKALVERVFREAHSLKGAARSVSLRGIETVCQALEGAFAALKREEILLSPELCELFQRAVDTIAQLVTAAGAERASADRAADRELIRQLGLAAAAGGAAVDTAAADAAGSRGGAERSPETPGVPAPEENAAAAGERTPHAPSEGQLGPAGSIRISTAKLDPLLLQAEEMIAAKMAASQRVTDMNEITRELAAWQRDETLRPDRHAGTGERLQSLHGRAVAVAQTLEKDQRQLRRMVDEHLEAVKQVLMLPIASLVEVMPRLVRDLARDQGKEVDLVVNGAGLEIDKRILEELKDPLIHLVRNCIDHGIGKPEERAAAGKPRRGTLTLSFGATVGRRLEVIVDDDGAGIDTEQVRAAAIRSGAVATEQAGKLDPDETLALIFRSGITTSRIITDISGRGLGLAIVREKVERLNGIVAVESVAGRGTSFRLLLPMTLATFRGVLVREDDQLFVLPSVSVERATRVLPEEIRTVENRETIRLDGQVLALVRLRDVLGMTVRAKGTDRKAAGAGAAAGPIPCVVLASGDARIAFRVDEVLDELQVLVKGLGRQLSRVRNIAGATILGSGRVVPVLNAADLMKSAVRAPAAVRATVGETVAAAISGNILVAEDSITSRTLIKNILETAGYRVTTAVDGADGLMQARAGDFDLVVSDVDMPRLSGFELTERIRADKRLAELPVVLVTALESREDRERGVEAGANAYIIKSSFDQSNLLEVVRRLL
ncbi:MAG: hybrid sensor histidine kinase/response regulator [Candidatus Methylomirabilia bacterium]